MKELIEKLYSDYGKYINEYRSFPHINDGLKIVERRLLYSMFELAKDKFVKSAKVVGHTIGCYHPHGDCLHGEQLIELLDGTTKSMKWLCDNYKDKKFWVYSCDEKTGKVVPGLAHSPRVGQTTNIMYQITLDNNQIIRCTENHPFMMKDCTYNMAKDLKFDDCVISRLNNYVKIKRNISIILDEPMKFYDITVDLYNNFALSNGCFVHNSSAYGSLVNLVYNDLVIGQGNFGCRVGIEQLPAAAMRYTEVKSSRDILKDCFEYIKYVKYEALELDEEPVSLPVKLPICLMGNSECQGMGFGYRTMIPYYDKQDLVKRLFWLVSKKDKEFIIKPTTDCKILSGDDQFKELLETGKAKIDFRGKFSVIDNKNLVIRSFPVTKTFQAVLNKFKKELIIDKSLGWRDNSSKQTEIVFTILKIRMLKMDQLKKKLNEALTGSLTYECNMCNDDGKVVLVSVDQMLLYIYKRYINHVQIYLNDQINKLDMNIYELQLIEKMKPLLSVSLKENPNNVEKVIKDISVILKKDIEIIKNIFEKYNLNRIFKVKTDTIKLEKEKKEFKDKLNNIIKYVWNDKYLPIINKGVK